ncbi:mercuric transporter MerT family protein [Campylobacter sp. RM16192]|uniref:mercuric transporter MerT family protein n=1 Tax=Campylobacter sp. RM16192 TaxID=1660080 RepID=UPI001451460B|nr:mercuric transporter MerT family protein [Campylobacter sp. RM16192]QCD52881.1 putative mercury transporter, membrane protein MerT [Campylobacter sp. RM16192]
MRSVFLAIASIISAFAATLCCLPALVFLIFGATFSLLGSEAIESLTALRPYFTALALICFVASGFYMFKKQKSCDIKNRSKKWVLIYILLAVFVIILLSYPEVLGAFYA